MLFYRPDSALHSACHIARRHPVLPPLVHSTLLGDSCCFDKIVFGILCGGGEDLDLVIVWDHRFVGSIEDDEDEVLDNEVPWAAGRGRIPDTKRHSSSVAWTGDSPSPFDRSSFKGEPWM